jgi:predicted esterase
MEEAGMINDPHAGRAVLHAGQALESAPAVVLMLHGRGASAEDILGLASEFGRADLAYLAPQAASGAWYPQRFLAPLAANEPWLTSALTRIETLRQYVEQIGIPAERTFLLGFSQGACLVLEYAARNTRRYAGVIGLSGGLIGPDGTPRDYPGSLGGTPVFLGCSDIDFHIPKERVLESAEVLRRIGANVDARLYPGMGHTINEDELQAVKTMLADVVALGVVEGKEAE